VVADGDDGVVVLSGVAATDAEDFVVVCHGDTVAAGCGPASGQFPGCAVHEQCGVRGCVAVADAAGDGQRQRVDSIGPDFGATVPGFFIGEVGTADDEQVIFGDSGEGSGEAFGIGERWQFFEAEGGWCCGVVRGLRGVDGWHLCERGCGVICGEGEQQNQRCEWRAAMGVSVRHGATSAPVDSVWFSEILWADVIVGGGHWASGSG